MSRVGSTVWNLEPLTFKLRVLAMLRYFRRMKNTSGRRVSMNSCLGAQNTGLLSTEITVSDEFAPGGLKP